MLFLTRKLGHRVAAGVGVATATFLGSGEDGFTVRIAHAEPPLTAPAAAPIVPPRPLETAVGYPDGANGDATVGLELVVDADGSVAGVGAVEGPEPFATVARRAAVAWKFAPAERGGKAVRVRIRFEARFVGEHLLSPPEPATPAPTPEPAAGATPRGSAPAPDAKPAEYKVTVRGQRAAPGGVTVSRTEARLLPGAFGDPFRAIGALPGVTPVVSVIPLFFLRGAPPGNVGYFIDGIRIPALFHALLGPPVLAPALIDRVDVYPGGAPARYGRFAGGIIAAESAEPSDALHGEAQLGVLDTAAVVSSPLADGRAHVTAAGRFSFTQFIVPQLTNLDVGYWDYQLRASYDLTSSDVIGVFAFGGLDFARDTTAADSGQVLNQNAPETGTTQFHRVDIRYDHTFSPSTHLRLATTLGYDHSALSGGTLSDLSTATRLELLQHLGSSDVLHVGVDVAIDGYRLELDPDPTLNFRDATFLFPSRTQVTTGAYADFELHPSRGIIVRPGLRTDIYRSEGLTAAGIDPRISASYEVSSKLKLIHTLGLAHQTPNYLPNVPGVQIGGLHGGLQTSLQHSAGFELSLPEDVTGSLTFFQQDFFNLSDPLGFSRQATFNADVASLRGMGYAYGAEVMLRRPLARKLGGIFSYTLSRSIRSHENITSPSAFDHTHVVSAALGYDFGNRFRVGARGVLFSGVPTSHITANGPVFGDPRGPWYFRLDLRVEKRFRLGQNGYWGLLAEVVNATAATEVTGRTCSVVRCTEARVGPLVLPNVGLEAGF